MSQRNSLKSLGEVAELRARREPLFGLGSVYITPGAIAVLEQGGVPAPALLTMHQLGEWGIVGKEDSDSNDRALVDGSRLLSAWMIEGQRVWIITEAADDDDIRHTSTILLASEY